MGHPNLSDEINANIDGSTEENGVFVDKLPVGTQLIVRTESGSTYRITTILSAFGKLLVCGGRYFPTPIATYFSGSTWGGSMLKMQWIGVGMHMEFPHNRGAITTSAVESIQIIRPASQAVAT